MLKGDEKKSKDSSSARRVKIELTDLANVGPVNVIITTQENNQMPEWRICTIKVFSLLVLQNVL